jgi:cell division transport system ATP-binding protein
MLAAASRLGGGVRVVRFDNVGMRYGLGPEVLRDITLHLKPGSFHFLMGPSGAGKSTLLKLLYLALRPSRGLITLFGRDIATTSHAALPELRRRIGVVFQDFRLLEHLSVLDNVALPLQIAGLRNARVLDHVTEMLDWVGLGDRLEDRPSTLSGGEQQRVAICRAVVTQPHLLVADEPTGNVDDAIGHRLMRLFEELNRNGTTVVVATHNRSLVEPYGHPRIAMRDGALVGIEA